MSKPFEVELENGDVFCGSANRLVKLGFIALNVYSFGLYVDAAAAKDCLSEYADKTAAELSQDETFYHSFVAGKFRKNFVLKMCRSLPRHKMIASFTKSLLSRVDVDGHTEAKQVVENLVPGEFKEDDVVKLVMDADGETVTGFVKDEQVFQVKSSGPNGIWCAFQNIFYDMNTEVHEIKHNSISGMEQVLRSNEATVGKEEEPQVEDDELPKEEVKTKAEKAMVVSKGSELKSKTVNEETLENKYESSWKLFSGRENGKDGYQLGDITRMFLRKWVFGGYDPNLDAKRTLEIEKLQERNKDLESTVFKLEQALRDQKEECEKAAGQVSVLGAFELCTVVILLCAVLPSAVYEQVGLAMWGFLAICILEVLKGPNSQLPAWGIIGSFHLNLLKQKSGKKE